MTMLAMPACGKPTQKYPQGRTGTIAGYHAHRTVSESACEPCITAHGAYRLLSKYGLTPEDYRELLAAQNGKCAICQQEAKHYAVDHDHVTGQVRGLLCDTCNVGLGHFRDDVGRLMSAAAYLLSHGKERPE